MFFRLVKQLAEKEGITEELKNTDQMAWIGAMNNIQARTREIVDADLIYAWSHFRSGMGYSFRFFFLPVQ